MLVPGPVSTTFESLLAKAVAKFDKLRDIPAHSVQELSHQYQKAFSAFHACWGYQQQNRRALVEAGLRRSDIGEIASKIGHLHFNWYLRCSDTRFLIESYVFYEAIHARQYYDQQDSSLLDSSGNLTVHIGAASGGGGGPGAGGPSHEVVAEQQLKYYARFILVCIMLGKKEEAVNLMQEFQALVAAHAMSQEAAGSQGHTGGSSTHEWRLVLAEVGCLLMADPGMPLPRSPGAALSFRPCCRASPTSQEADCFPHVPYIHHAVLVGYHHRQVKLAELPIDMLRMMQALEWQDGRLMSLEGGGEVAQGPVLTAHTAAAQPGSTADSPLHPLGPNSSLAFTDNGTASGRAAPPPPTSSHSSAIARATSMDLGLMPAPPAAAHPIAPASCPPAPGSPRHANPRKTMLYRTTAPAVLSSLHSVAASLEEDSPQVLLLYLSCSSMKARLAAAAAHLSSSVALNQVANRERSTGPVPALPPVASTSCLTSSLAAATTSASLRPCQDLSGADLGNGWCLSPPRAGGRAGPASVAQCVLRALDLQPLTRHRLFVVVDGDVSGELRSLVGQELGHPLLALMSPRHRPSAFGDAGRTGQLLTLFLTLPVSAFCLIMGEADPTPNTLRALQDAVDESLGAIATALGQALLSDVHGEGAAGGLGSRPGGHGLNSSPRSAAHSRSSSGSAPTSAWALPFQDVLLRQFMCRFVLARAALAYHRASTGRPECQPDCSPDMPDLVHPSTSLCIEAVERVAAVLKRQALFEGHVSLVVTDVGGTAAAALPPGLAASSQEAGALGAAAAALPAASRSSSTTSATQPLPVPGAKGLTEGLAALGMGPGSEGQHSRH